MPRKKTHDEFCQEVREKTGEEYTVMTNYILTATKLTMRHNTKDCGHEFLIRPADFIKGSRCPKCYKKERYGKKSENEQTIEN